MLVEGDEHEHGRADDVRAHGGAVLVNIDEQHDPATPTSAQKLAQKKWLANAEAAAGAESSAVPVPAAIADDSIDQSLDVESSFFWSWREAAIDKAAAISEQLSLAAAEDKPLLDNSSRSSMDSRARRQRILSMVVLWALPTACCVWYAAAIFFPVDAQAAVPALLWTPGAAVWVNGKVTCCPKPALCSEGWAQFWLLVAARLSAFAMYPSLLLVFFSKCHAALRFLSRTFVAELLPLNHLHDMHTFHGLVFASLALCHTVVHLVRWGLRGEIDNLLGRWTGTSGAIGMALMLAVTGSMLLPRLLRCPMRLGRLAALGKTPFELRFNIHYCFIPLAVALCIHSGRLLVLTLVATSVWMSDYVYQVIFRTFRLDVVEFTRLQDGGVQVLWSNPNGFSPNSGEFVKIQLPWLPEPWGSQWHPFSLYLKEATATGLSGMHALGKEPAVSSGRVFPGPQAKGGSEIAPSTTALLMIEFQNDLASPGGKLHLSIKGVMDSLDVLAKCQSLCTAARKAGAKVFHVPISFEKPDGSDNPNAKLGMLKGCQDGQLFRAHSWGADFHPMMSPAPGDVVIQGKRRLDSFRGTDLEARLREHGIETVVLGGFITNCCVESTMRTAFEKGFNTITLTDGTACFSAAEQDAATNGTFKMFSTPMSCSDVAAIFENPETQAALMVDSRRNSEIDSTLFDIVKSQQVCQARIVEGTGIDEAARKGLEAFDTTQIFVIPAGDWTRALSRAVFKRCQRRACWIRGPFVSPYAAAKDFSQLILFASGIGITPALGVMGQYPGSTRMKFLIWSTRSAPMLKFFAPLLGDAQLCLVFYTGKPKLDKAELATISGHGNIIVSQQRPDLEQLLEQVLRGYEKSAAGISLAGELNLSTLDRHTKAAWCAFYCGGSHAIRDKLQARAKDLGIGFQAELFDW